MPATAFGFRPWVRSTCRRAMLWGLGVLALLAAVVWMLRTAESSAAGRAFGILLLYGLLFLATLGKIWWTAGRPAVVLDADAIAYQPLHTFAPKRIAFDKVLASAPRAGTQSHGLAHEYRPGRARELFLNLAVVDGRHRLLDELDRRLSAAGLEPVPGEPHAWRRAGWTGDSFGASPADA